MKQELLFTDAFKKCVNQVIFVRRLHQNNPKFPRLRINYNRYINWQQCMSSVQRTVELSVGNVAVRTECNASAEERCGAVQREVIRLLTLNECIAFGALFVFGQEAAGCGALFGNWQTAGRSTPPQNQGREERRGDRLEVREPSPTFNGLAQVRLPDFSPTE